MNVRKAFRPAQARGNMAAAKIDWRTRIKGTPRQLGQKFPIVAEKGHLAPQRWGKRRLAEQAKITRLELDTMRAEREMEAAGFKGFTIGIKMKDGTVDEIPLIAKEWHTAFNVARMRMKNYNPDQIDEITIIDPSARASELSAAQELIAKRRATAGTMTPSEIERRKRSSRRPFQSRVFSSDGTTSSVTSEESTTLGKAKEHLRKAKWALKGALG